MTDPIDKIAREAAHLASACAPDSMRLEVRQRCHDAARLAAEAGIREERERTVRRLIALHHEINESLTECFRNKQTLRSYGGVLRMFPEVDAALRDEAEEPNDAG